MLDAEIKARQYIIEELAKKLRLESSLSKNLKTFFNHLANHFYSLLLVHNEVVQFEKFTPELTALLKTNYRKAARLFKNNLRDKYNLGRDLHADKIDLAINEQIDKIAPRRAGYIIDTTQKVARNALQTAHEETQKPKSIKAVTWSIQVIAGIAFDEFKKSNLARIATIAASEAQKISEDIKQTEAVRLTADNIVTAQKQWDALLDSHTRPAHAAADGQRVDIDKPFTVDGELLMYPGDDSIGVSLSNVINCRCSSQIIVAK